MLEPGEEYGLSGRCDVGRIDAYLPLDPRFKAMYVRSEKIYGEDFETFAVKMRIGDHEHLARIKVPTEKFEEDSGVVESQSFRLKRISDNPWWHNSKQVESFLVRTLELAESKCDEELAEITRKKIEVRSAA